MDKSQHLPEYARLLRALREAREKAGLTQVEVGQAFGTHASFVSKCESGERRIDLIELVKFCNIYKVKVSRLLKKVGLE